MEALQASSLRAPPLKPFQKPNFNPHFPRVSRLVPSRLAKIFSSITSSVSAPSFPSLKRVVITGMGLVSAFINYVDTYYDKLLARESEIGHIDRFDAFKFPTQFADQIWGFTYEGYIDGKNDRRFDDCLRYCIVVGKKALEHADLGSDKLPKVIYWLLGFVNRLYL